MSLSVTCFRLHSLNRSRSYNCRELGHKTFECTKNLSCRSCGTAGHKERQCPQGTVRPPSAPKGGDLETSLSLSNRRTDTEEADAARSGDGLLRLPQQPPLWRPPKKQQKRPPPLEHHLQDFLSSYFDNLLSEPAPSSPPNEMSLPPPIPAKPFPDQIRPPSPARSAPEMAIEEDDLTKNRSPRDSSLQRIEKAARHLSFAAGGPNRIDYVADTDRLEPFRSRAGSSNTRMSTSWFEDETEWDGATMSFDNRYRQQSFCFDLLGRRAPARRTPSPLDSILPMEDITIVTGTSSTQIAFSFPVKEARASLPNEYAAKYQHATNVVGRALWLINPALLFHAEPEPPRSDWDDECFPVPPRPPTLAVSAPLDNGSS